MAVILTALTLTELDQLKLEHCSDLEECFLKVYFYSANLDIVRPDIRDTVGCHTYWRGAIFARKFGLHRHLGAAVTTFPVD